MKKYNVFIAGSTKVAELEATCITKAAKHFILTLDRPVAATYHLCSTAQASIRYVDNHHIMSDYVVIEA